jgi:transcriptional regulator with XRE-family HTH domain
LKNKIKYFREESNLSQEKLAAISGVSRTIISGLESGRVDVTTTSTLKKIAEALGKTVGEIFF